MNENINLCEILKGCEGIELYSSVHGLVELVKIDEDNSAYPIRCIFKATGDLVIFTKEGKYTKVGGGECILFPSKDKRDWSNFKKPIPIDTPMMCSNDKIDWTLRYYKCNNNGSHLVIVNGYRSFEKEGTAYFNITIPYNKFNPNNIEESLKYNIQK